MARSLPIEGGEPSDRSWGFPAQVGYVFGYVDPRGVAAEIAFGAEAPCTRPPAEHAGASQP